MKRTEKFFDLFDEDEIKANVIFFVGEKDGSVMFAAVDSPQDVSRLYPMDWKTAAYIGYCLIQEAIYSAGSGVVASYLLGLSKRKNEIAEWLNDCTRLFLKAKPRRKINGKDKHL